MTSFDFQAGMFGKDLGTALKYDFLDLNYHDSGTGTSNPSFGIPNVASVYGNLTASYEVAFSLLGTARLDLGSLKTSFNFNSHADASPNHPTPNGGAFIDTSRFTSSDILQTGIHATGANAENSFIKMELGASLDSHVTATVGYNYDIFVASGTGSKTIIDNGVSLGFKPTEIFKITGEDLADAFTRDFKYGSLSAALPDFTYDTPTLVQDGSQFGSLHITGESTPFLTAQIDLDTVLRLPVSAAAGIDFGPASFSVDAGLFDAKLTGTASLGQDITYTPDVDVTMRTSLGETVKGNLGDKFEFDTPEGEGTFKVEATYQMSVTLEAITSVIFGASFDWKVGYGNFAANLSIPGYSKSWTQGFAMAQGSEPFGDGFGIEIMRDVSTYHLGRSLEHYTVSYENFVTAASGRILELTTHQKNVDGGSVDNTILGNDLGNHLDGHGGKDLIRGGAGRDVLNGGNGNDTLEGGKGTDTFVFSSAGKHFLDTIRDMDFVRGDTIDLSGLDANIKSKTDQAFDFIHSDAFNGHAGQLRFERSNGDTVLTGDWNGDRNADFSIVMHGDISFVAAQMVL